MKTCPVESFGTKPVIETDRKKIENNIKKGRPLTGMTKEDVLKTPGRAPQTLWPQ
ncbi:MAG: hypothetical protein GTO02_21540 [Candidatus Dadabacteria bacterium]|nr:hypothetical protein [Candidatus Dadabacteria bacterium]NIQ16868.1 hypothetical protein [Candidatus Dadabacteria bacterium]